MKLAIDFGTTNTVIARWNEGAPEIVSIPGLSIEPNGLPALVPSLVYLHDGQAGQVTIGEAVREQALDQQRDNRLFRNFKRGIVALPSPPPREIDGSLWGDRDAGQTFLRGLIDALPLEQGEVDQLVLTAPVAAFESYLSWLSAVIGDLASERVFVVDESTAAALGYAVTEPGAPVLVLDFGGGTLDLSLVLLPESREQTGGVLSRLRRGSVSQNTARVIAKAGRVIGGSDIDQWLVAAVLDRLHLTAADLGHGYATLLTRCEEAKIRLSTEEHTAITVEAGEATHSAVVTRDDLEALLEAHGFYDTLRHVVDKVMHIAHRSGIFKEDIQHVLLVGGVSLMPSVQATLRQYFGNAAVRADKPFTAVAEGALQVAAGYGLDDYLGQGYGLRHLDPETGEHRYDEIIPLGSRYPTAAPVEVILSAAHEDQEAVEFVVGEIGGESGALVEVSYEGGQTVFVAQADTAAQQVIPLNVDAARRTLAHLKPAGKPGQDRVRARFSVDEQRRLRLSVYDLKTRRELVQDAVIATLGKQEASPNGAEATITGREPRLARAGGKRRLSLRGVATMLNMLPPQSISLEAAEAALRSPSFQARYSAAVALSKRGDRAARLVMQRVLADGEVPARASAARHLGSFTWYGVEPLVRQALADPDSRVREAAIYTLCDLRELDAYRLMSEALVDEEDNVREAAAFGLRDCQDPAAVPVLRAALLANDPDVRVKALEALSANNTSQAIPVVRAALRDPHPDVIYAATLSLLELAREECVDELAELIANSRSLVRERLLRAFFHATNYLNIVLAGHPAADRLIGAFENALSDKSAAARRAAIWPLAWMRHERTPSILKRAYADEQNGEVKAHIVRVAVSLMSAAGEDILQHALHSSEPIVKMAAEQIMAERERTGIVLLYDEEAALGTGLAKPSMGR